MSREYGFIDMGETNDLIVRSTDGDTGEWSDWEFVLNGDDLPEFVLEDLPQPQG